MFLRLNASKILIKSLFLISCYSTCFLVVLNTVTLLIVYYTLFCVNVASVLSITEKVVLKGVQCVMKRFLQPFCFVGLL